MNEISEINGPDEFESDQPSPPPIVAELVAGPPAKSLGISVPSMAISWFLICGLVALLVVLHAIRPEVDDTLQGPSLDVIQMNFVGKLFVGIKELSKQSQSLGSLPLEEDNVDQQLCRAILENELSGPASGLDVIKELRGNPLRWDLSRDQQRAANVLQALFRNYAAEDWSSDSVPKADREFLRRRFGWCGRLALTPRESPNTDARQRLEMALK